MSEEMLAISKGLQDAYNNSIDMGSFIAEVKKLDFADTYCFLVMNYYLQRDLARQLIQAVNMKLEEVNRDNDSY